MVCKLEIKEICVLEVARVGVLLGGGKEIQHGEVIVVDRCGQGRHGCIIIVTEVQVGRRKRKGAAVLLGGCKEIQQGRRRR